MKSTSIALDPISFSSKSNLLFIAWKIHWKLKSQHVFCLFMIFKWILITKRITGYATHEHIDLNMSNFFFCLKKLNKNISKHDDSYVEFVCSSPQWHPKDTTETSWYSLLIIFFFNFFFGSESTDNAYENICLAQSSDYTCFLFIFNE